MLINLPSDFEIPEELVSAGQGYEALFVASLFDSWTRHLVEGAGIQHGSHVLDIACGTGVLARHALCRAGSAGRVVGVDPAPGMLAAAEGLEPGIEWMLGSAEALQLEDGTFDSVVSQFGMMFFEDREKSMQEMGRVLKSSGSLAVAVWNSIEHNPAYADIISVLQDQVGTAAADALRLPYSLGNADRIAGELEDNGFVELRVETRTETARFPSSRHMVEAELRGWLPLFDIHLSEDKIAEVLSDSERTLAKYENVRGEAEFPTSAHIITAKKR